MFKYKIKDGSAIGITVEAVQLVDGNEEAILAFLDKTHCQFILIGDKTMTVGNPNESFTASKDEWLVQGSSGEFFSISADEFDSIYIPYNQPYPQEGPMEFITFARRPFIVEAVQVTTENIAEIAKHVGTLKNEGDAPYIQVDRRLVPNIFKVQPGFWMTKMETPNGPNIRCYSDHIFKAQFMEQTPEVAEWLNELDVEVTQSV